MLALIALTGCGSMKPADFQERTPELRIEDYFLGRTYATGIFQDRFGSLRREFTVDIDGQLQGDVLTLDEDFCYADGERARRVWTITRTGPGRYQGTADDVVGTADGEAVGNALHWKYRLKLPIGGKTWEVALDDWMFLQPGRVLVNRAVVSKWGLELGEVTLFFTKQTPEESWRDYCDRPVGEAS